MKSGCILSFKIDIKVEVHQQVYILFNLNNKTLNTISELNYIEMQIVTDNMLTCLLNQTESFMDCNIVLHIDVWCKNYFAKKSIYYS